MKFRYAYQGKVHNVELIHAGMGFRALVDGESTPNPVGATVASQGRQVWVHFGGRTYQLERVIGQRQAAEGAGGEQVLRAPMPGQVRGVKVKVGQHVQDGQLLLLLEAMKMEIKNSGAAGRKSGATRCFRRPER